MEPFEVKTDTAQTNNTGSNETIIDGDKIRFWRRFWRIVAVLIFVFVLILIIVLLATTKDTTEDEKKETSTDIPTPSPLAFETPAPTAHYLDTIRFPSTNFRIQSYTNPTGSLSSIITKPRAIRSAYASGATILYIGSSGDNAYVMIDYDSDGTNDAEFTIFESSSVGSDYSPASLALSSDGNNDLYISLTNMIVKCDGNVHQKVLAFTSSEDRLSECNKILDIPLTPEDEGKPWNLRRYIGISNTNELCVSNGMTCDNCAHESVDVSFPHGTITCFQDLSISAMNNTNMSDANDPNIIIKANGVRNSVGFDWHPNNNGFYFTDNGRDEVHENYPDDELNFVVGNDNHFGFPNCHSLGSGNPSDRSTGCRKAYIDPNISNTEYIDCSSYQHALQPLGPHVVPLGIRFYTGSMFPTEFTNSIFIAQRGSPKAPFFGYRIGVVKLSSDGTQVLNHQIFADGFYDYNNDITYGRPVDVEVLNDGSLVISDDYANQIYRIEYVGSRDHMIFDNSNDPASCNYSYVQCPVPFEANLLSNDFSIAYYTCPQYSIIKQPRALRTAYYNGVTLVYVGSKRFNSDQAYVMIDYDSDGTNDAEFIIFESSSVGSEYSPASLALSSDGNSDLYISLTNMIVKCDGNVHEQVLNFTSSADRLNECNKILDIPLTPEDEDKPWNLRRYIGISNTNELCVSNGMTCDNCAHESVDISFPHGTITCFQDSSYSAMINTNMSDMNDPNIIIKADGVRNSVGFDWHPNNNRFYFTDNGRDEVHENYPDDELNVVVGNDNHFGFPNCHSLGSGPVANRDVNCDESYIDPNISNPSSVNCWMYEGALQALGPHVVPLGMRFYTGTMFPTDFTNCIFIAERGSGDSNSYGYRIAVIKLSEDGSAITDHKIFVDGFYDYNTNKVNGRPVEVAVLNDGSLLISDDNTNGAIYRIKYTGNSIDSYLQSSTSTANCNFSYVN